MKAYTSLSKSELLFNTDKYFKKYICIDLFWSVVLICFLSNWPVVEKWDSWHIVSDLDKYVQHHTLIDYVNFKKLEKVFYIQRHFWQLPKITMTLDRCKNLETYLASMSTHPVTIGNLEVDIMCLMITFIQQIKVHQMWISEKPKKMRKLLSSFLGEMQQHIDSPNFCLTSALLEFYSVLDTYEYDNWYGIRNS